MNELYLRLRNKVYLAEGEGGASLAQVAAVQKEAEALGFVFSEALLERLQTQSVQALAGFLRVLLKTLRELTGAHRSHRPLYPDFPQQVLEASSAELYLNAVRHYLTLRRLPGEASSRPALLHERQPREIKLGSVEDFEAIFTRLVSSRSSLSTQEKADVAWFVRSRPREIFRLLPKAIPFKENLAVLGSQLYRHASRPEALAFLHQHLKTATDVLRLAVALRGGDVSLAAPTRFKSMPRSQRRMLLECIERTGDPTEDMLRWPERWKRLGEVLHPGDFAQRFPRTHAAFAILRGGLPFVSWRSTVEQQLAAGHTGAALETLVSCPGELARRLDHLLRSADEAAPVVAAFARVAEAVSTPVLLQVLSHFVHRAGATPLRTFFPKGDAAKAYAIADRRPALSEASRTAIVSACEGLLVERFARLPPLGRCFVDPALGGYLVPLAQRSASRSMRTLVRGSRLPLPPAAFIRLFLWWTNGRGPTDIDLSAVLYGADFDYLDDVAYYNLKRHGAYHSGDIVDAPEGASEFIDLELDRLREAGVRFVVVALSSYSRQPYAELPECFAGWMARSELNSGEVFEARTVEDRLDLTSDATFCIPFVLDLQERHILWTDIGLTEQPSWINVRNNLSGVSLMLRAMSTLARPDLFTLFSLHAQARGQRVATPQEAQTVFSVHEGVTPFDLACIRSAFL